MAPRTINLFKQASTGNLPLVGGQCLSREARRVRDKWRDKSWCSIVSPPYFGGVEVGSAPSSDLSKMTGRVVETTLYEITGQLSESHIKLYFRISGLKGVRADTVFVGHEYQRDYLRSLVRRGSSRVDDILNVKTKDGYMLRVSVVVFTVSRIRSSTKVTLRKLMRSKVRDKSEQLNFDQFIQEIVLGKVASEIYNEGKSICPLRHVGIRKSKLISIPIEGEVRSVPKEKEQETEPAESD